MFSGKVDFVVAGTQKGGTTALDGYLRQHPSICMADVKEVHFFDEESNFKGGQSGYGSYHAHFRASRGKQISGEVTPSYMYWLGVPRRMWEYNPRLKIVMILRNPIERAYSAWNMERLRGVEDRSFWDALRGERERCRESLPLQHKHYSYVDRGYYAEQIRRIWTFFPEAQTLILRTEQLREEPRNTLDVLCRFLDVDRFSDVQPRIEHTGNYESLIGERERKYLADVFEYPIRDLERMLGWDCSGWLA